MKINRPSEQPGATAFDGWTIDESGLVLSIWFWDEMPFGSLRLFTSETDDEVQVLAVDSAKPLPGEPAPFLQGGALYPLRWTAQLTRPLGERTVVDGATGKPRKLQGPPFVPDGPLQ